MKQDSCGDRHIQRIDLAEEGNGKKDITVFFDERSHPFAFAAHDETYVTLETDRSEIAGGAGIGAVDPESLFLQKFNGLGEIDDLGHRDVTSGTGRGLDDGRGDPGGTVAGDDDPVGTEAVGRADQGAEVLGSSIPSSRRTRLVGKAGWRFAMISSRPA